MQYAIINICIKKVHHFNDADHVRTCMQPASKYRLGSINILFERSLADITIIMVIYRDHLHNQLLCAIFQIWFDCSARN